MAKIIGRLIGFLTVFLIIYNINIVFATNSINGNDETNRLDDENEYDRVQSTPVPTVTNQSVSVYDKLEKGEGVVGSDATLTRPVAANSSDDMEQKQEETEDDVPGNEKKSNFTVNQIEEHHLYYNSTIVVDKERTEAYWNEIQNKPFNDMLTPAHRRAKTVALSFDFPFYGYPIRNVTIATGGFIYTGDYVHSWLSATQYIAPLMANFDTSLSNDSFVRFSDTGSSFTVIWENVYLQAKQDVGKFTFSTTLHKNGDIVFTYFSMPILVNAIQDDKHPVKVGLSDAYIINKVVSSFRRKTIYEYHRVNFANADITNSTIITLKALPTCLEYTDCASCLKHATAFNCLWCPTMNRCSPGKDRKRQDWIANDCDRHHVNETAFCPANVSETFTKEEVVVTSDATLTTSVRINSSHDSVEKKGETFVTDNPSDRTEQKKEETVPVDNRHDDTVQKEEKITEATALKTDNVTENATLKASEKNNLIINQTKNHDHYYNITFVVDKEKVDAHWEEIRDWLPNWELSRTDQKSLTVALNFEFPFYGHPIRTVAVTTGGYILTGDFEHSVKPSMRYIAPLFGNFDPRLSIDSVICLKHTDSSFTVLWESVQLKDNQDVGEFSFSTTLHKNGDIVFTYYSVPIVPKGIKTGRYLLKVGISDSKYYRTNDNKEIYKYRRANLDVSKITDSTIVTLKAVSTCPECTDCDSCEKISVN